MRKGELSAQQRSTIVSHRFPRVEPAAPREIARNVRASRTERGLDGQGPVTLTPGHGEQS
jgi:hypothetical protein